MKTENLTLWALDLGLSEALVEFPLKSIQKYDWNWAKFHTDLLKSLRNKDTAPDLINIGTTYTGRLIQEGVLLNITKFATEELNICNTFFPRTLFSCQNPFRANQYYAFPLLADVRVLFYNTELIDTYLSEHPNAFTHWNAFERMCMALRDRRLHRRAIAWSLDTNAFHDVLPWVWAAGGDIVSLSNQLLIDSEYTQNAVLRLARLILTDCAPTPPDPSFHSPDRVRTQFEIGNVGITSGTLWLGHTRGWQGKFKAMLHPSDAFPSTFVGGSNLAIVRKYGDDENNEAYRPAKDFLATLVSRDNQLKLAKSTGKLPCNIAAWEQMRKAVTDKDTEQLFNTFNVALCYTVERGMPNLPNFVQIEEELKTSISMIWEEVGKLKNAKPGLSLKDLEAKCKVMITDKLTETRQKIEKFTTNFVVQYTQNEVEQIGLTPPGQFDLWLKMTQDTPPNGDIYIVDRGKIQKGIGPKPFQMLLALLNAPQRTLHQEELLRTVWKFKAASDHKRLDDIIRIADQLPNWAELLESSFKNNASQMLDILQRHKTELPFSTIISLLQERNKWPNFRLDDFQSLLCRKIGEYSEAIAEYSDNSKRKNALNTLRITFERLHKILGEVRGKPIIERSAEQGSDFVYYLDKDLSICLETP